MSDKSDKSDNGAMRYLEGLQAFAKKRCKGAVPLQNTTNKPGGKGREVAKLTFGSEDVKSAAVPPCEEPLTW